MVDRPVAAAGTEAGSVEVVGVVVGVAMAATRAVEESLEVRAAREEVTAAGPEAVSEAGLEASPEERSAGAGTAASAGPSCASRRGSDRRRACVLGVWGCRRGPAVFGVLYYSSYFWGNCEARACTIRAKASNPG